MKTAADILATKEHRLLTIDAEVSVVEVARRMIEENIGSMLVSVGGRITGWCSRTAPTGARASARS